MGGDFGVQILFVLLIISYSIMGNFPIQQFPRLVQFGEGVSHSAFVLQVFVSPVQLQGRPSVLNGIVSFRLNLQTCKRESIFVESWSLIAHTNRNAPKKCQARNLNETIR